MLGFCYGNSLAANSHMGIIRRELCVLFVDVVRVYVEVSNAKRCRNLRIKSWEAQEEEKAWQEKEKVLINFLNALTS